MLYAVDGGPSQAADASDACPRLQVPRNHGQISGVKINPNGTTLNPNSQPCRQTPAPVLVTPPRLQVSEGHGRGAGGV